MFGIRKIHQRFEDMRMAKREEKSNNPFTEVPAFEEPEINTKITRSMYDLRRLVYLNEQELIDPHENLYFYNAGFYENTPTTYRMFYRCGKNPKAYEDRVATCLLDRDFNILPNTNKYLELHSSWEETTRDTFKFKEMIPFKFKYGTHVEDPRAIRYGNNWFVFYTDGITMGVAKLDENCNTIYSHYLHVPEGVTNLQTDGREKNWIPIMFKDGFLHVLYSDTPKILFKYKDKETSLALVRTISLVDSITWKHGSIRGGCPPVPYTSDKLIWFFHSTKTMPTHVHPHSRVYGIGAYITSNTYPYDIVKITTLPILIGWPSHAVSKIIIQDNVVYPCGAIQKEDDTYVVCMGINDYRIAYLTVKVSDLIWEDIKTNSIKFIKSTF